MRHDRPDSPGSLPSAPQDRKFDRPGAPAALYGGRSRGANRPTCSPKKPCYLRSNAETCLRSARQALTVPRWLRATTCATCLGVYTATSSKGIHKKDSCQSVPLYKHGSMRINRIYGPPESGSYDTFYKGRTSKCGLWLFSGCAVFVDKEPPSRWPGGNFFVPFARQNRNLP